MNDNNTDYVEKLIEDEIKKLRCAKHGLESIEKRVQRGEIAPSDHCAEEFLKIDADEEIRKLEANIKSLELALDALDSVGSPVWCRDDLVDDVKVRVMSFVASWGRAYDAATRYCSDIVRMVGIIPECHRVYKDNVTERYDIYVSMGAFNSLSEEIHKVPVPSDPCDNQEDESS